jgi:hypothetical protein
MRAHDEREGKAMRTVVALAVLTSAGVAPAFASGGFWCSADDKSAKLSVQAGLTRGSGAMFNFRGELKILLTTVPADFRTLKLDGRDLIQRWLDDRESKLLIYRERARAPFGSISLMIETKRADTDDEGSYAGTYALTVSFMKSAKDAEATVVEARGDAACSAE